MNKDKIVSFDFDGTLSRPDVQEFAKELLAEGIHVLVVTSRYDDIHKHKYPFNPTNSDLWKVVDEIGISHKDIRFTLMKPKSEYLHQTNVIWHLDDDITEIININRKDGCTTKAIQVNAGSWKQKCRRLLEQ